MAHLRTEMLLNMIGVQISLDEFMIEDKMEESKTCIFDAKWSEVSTLRAS
jgi:hypothetical protein